MVLQILLTDNLLEQFDISEDLASDLQHLDNPLSAFNSAGIWLWFNDTVEDLHIYKVDQIKRISVVQGEK